MASNLSEAGAPFHETLRLEDDPLVDQAMPAARSTSLGKRSRDADDEQTIHPTVAACPASPPKRRSLKRWFARRGNNHAPSRAHTPFAKQSPFVVQENSQQALWQPPRQPGVMPGFRPNADHAKFNADRPGPYVFRYTARLYATLMFKRGKCTILDGTNVNDLFAANAREGIPYIAMQRCDDKQELLLEFNCIRQEHMQAFETQASLYTALGIASTPAIRGSVKRLTLELCGSDSNAIFDVLTHATPFHPDAVPDENAKLHAFSIRLHLQAGARMPPCQFRLPLPTCERGAVSGIAANDYTKLDLSRWQQVVILHVEGPGAGCDVMLGNFWEEWQQMFDFRALPSLRKLVLSHPSPSEFRVDAFNASFDTLKDLMVIKLVQPLQPGCTRLVRDPHSYGFPDVCRRPDAWTLMKPKVKRKAARGMSAFFSFKKQRSE